jgi:hypothetical protein
MNTRQIASAMEKGRSQMKIRETAALVAAVAGISLNLMFQDSLAAGEGDDWELKQLHDPSPSLRKKESAGRITIYDGVPVAEVDAAMDGQFDRIESMMFVRTKHPVADGTFEADSDCD